MPRNRSEKPPRVLDRLLKQEDWDAVDLIAAVSALNIKASSLREVFYNLRHLKNMQTQALMQGRHHLEGLLLTFGVNPDGLRKLDDWGVARRVAAAAFAYHDQEAERHAETKVKLKEAEAKLQAIEETGAVDPQG